VLRIYDADIDAPGEPLWSPDGSRLLIHQAALPPGAADPISDLRTRFVVFNAAGKEVSSWMASGRAETAAWSADGKRIAWVDGSHAFVAGADGEGEHVVADEADGYSVSWR
jgi:Tol biopolymer transport system component